jgi:enamine deaminase RidA (YjgF/YER057c/UK114 family)
MACSRKPRPFYHAARAGIGAPFRDSDPEHRPDVTRNPILESWRKSFLGTGLLDTGVLDVGVLDAGGRRLHNKTKYFINSPSAPGKRRAPVSHKRLRSIDATNAPGRYSRIVIAGSTVYLAGQTGFGLDGEPIVPGDPAAQARQACENIKTLIEEAGGDLSCVVKLTTYLTARAHREPVYAVIAEYFGEHAPASTGLIIDGMAHPDMLVEIDATAVLPG